MNEPESKKGRGGGVDDASEHQRYDLLSYQRLWCLNVVNLAFLDG